jgi:carboxylate-amine ligase
MKDVYWDIRPKPEFGTVEIRICDTPLTLGKAVMITAYIQALSQYLMKNKPIKLSPELYYLYNFNRFQASRYGLKGDIYDPVTYQSYTIIDDIYNTFKIIEREANALGNMPYLSKLMEELIQQRNDASFLREFFAKSHPLPEVVKEQCRIWSTSMEPYTT